MLERYIDISDHLKVRVKDDRWVQFLLALIIQHIPQEYSDLEALKVDYYIPDEETNPALLSGKEALLVAMRQLLETAIIESENGVSFNKYLFPRFHESIIEDGKRWLLTLETDSDLRQMLKRELSNEEKWHLVGQLIQASSSEPSAIEASLKEEVEAFEEHFQMNVLHPRILKFNNDEKAEEWSCVFEKLLAQKLRSFELNMDKGEGGRKIPEGMTASEFINQQPLLRTLSDGTVTQPDDPDAQTLLAFVYHTTQSALFPGFCISMTQSTDENSKWSDTHKEHLEAICRQVPQSAMSHRFEDHTMYYPLVQWCQIGTDDAGRWEAVFRPSGEIKLPYFESEWQHWIRIAHILGLTNGHLEGDIINQTRRTYRERVWALEDKFGIKLETDGSFIDWEGQVDPLIDRNKPFVPLTWTTRDENSEK